MNNLLPFIAIITSFVTGLVAGVMIAYFSFKLGFKANFEARLLEDELPDSKRLFTDKNEPAEFQLLRKENDEN